MAGTQSPRVELYLRALTSRTGNREQIIETLERLESDDAVADATVHVWGEAVELSSAAAATDRGEDILETVSTFRQWATQQDVSLSCGFENTEVSSQMTGQTYTRLTLPTVAMAEYVDGQLQYVTPHDDGDVTRVSDRLSALAATNQSGLEEYPLQSA